MLQEKTKKYQAMDFNHLIGMPGFSEKLLTSHFKLYQGYVTNTNTALEKLASFLAEGKDRSPEFAEIKRRLGWEFNGMRLHEYYFGNMGGKEQLSSSTSLHQAIAEHFGDFETWKKDFVSTGAMRGIGWVILYKDPKNDALVNFWIEEHQTNHLAGGQPLLVMDVFEHAFMIDYGLAKADYITAFFKNINWTEVERRFEGE